MYTFIYIHTHTHTYIHTYIICIYVCVYISLRVLKLFKIYAKLDVMVHTYNLSIQEAEAGGLSQAQDQYELGKTPSQKP